MVQKEIDYSKLGFNKCFELAHNGNVAAQYALGSKYYHVEGVKYNSEEAFKWIKKATEGGLVEAHYRLGELYERGIGVKRNFSKALKCYERAAGKGYQDAQHYLSACYFRIGEAYRTGNTKLSNFFSLRIHFVFALYSLLVFKIIIAQSLSKRKFFHIE